MILHLLLLLFFLFCSSRADDGRQPFNCIYSKDYDLSRVESIPVSEAECSRRCADSSYGLSLQHRALLPTAFGKAHELARKVFSRTAEAVHLPDSRGRSAGRATCTWDGRRLGKRRPPIAKILERNCCKSRVKSSKLSSGANWGAFASSQAWRAPFVPQEEVARVGLAPLRRRPGEDDQMGTG